ncbi:phosphodiester glycosidase family protein [Candidatus Woesearchaeota archaeon]|nr:phosphodiester glycosidase family protein [Candidatus Woesearchaeota archaeon]
MSKKAQTNETQWWLINFILLAVILVIMIAVITDLNASTSLERKHLAKDIALLVNSIYGSPNGLLYYYPENRFDFSIGFEEAKVKVFGKSDNDLVAKTYFFVEDSNVQMEYKTIESLPLGDYSGDEVIAYIPLGFRRFPTAIEPFSVLRTSDVLSGEDNKNVEGEFSYFEGTKEIDGISMDYYIVKAPLDPDIVIATDPGKEMTSSWSSGGKKTSIWAAEVLSGAEYSAAVNANFYEAGYLPRGIAAGSGNLYVEQVYWDAKSEIYLIPGVFLVYTDDKGKDTIEIINVVDSQGYDKVDQLITGRKIKQAVSGVPIMVEACQPVSTIPEWMERERRPRTAVAVDNEDDEMFLIVVNAARGSEFLEFLTTIEIAPGEKICSCQDNGCDILNLDGGGSSTIIVNGERKFAGDIAEKGADERTVANQLGIMIES